MVTIAQTNRLRALLLGGGDAERDLARATLADPVLLAMVRRREPPQASREQAVRHGEIRRLQSTPITSIVVIKSGRVVEQAGTEGP